MKLQHQLESNTSLRAAAAKTDALLRERLHNLVRKAAEDGWSKTRIAKAAGISRQTVHEILRAGSEDEA